MRLAILADIHGNFQALQAVAAKLEQLQPDEVIVVGDIINAVPCSNEVVEFLRGAEWIVVRGNHEFYYLDYAGGRAPVSWNDPERWGQLHWLIDHLKDEHGNYLAALPDDLILYYPSSEPVRVTHGTPGYNRRGFSNLMSEQEIATALSDVTQVTFINAHSHFQIDRIITESAAASQEQSGDPIFFLEEENHPTPRTWHVINPGSVGLPLNGDPRAQFAVIENVSPSFIPGGWRVSHHRVPYDRRPALAAYDASGMMESGGVISELFYWELATAEREIAKFFIWRRDNLPQGELSFSAEFEAYKQATGRDAYVRERDPLRNGVL